MAVVLSAPVAVMAQSPFAPAALQRAVQSASTQAPGRDALADWQRVERLSSGTAVIVAADGQSTTAGELVSVDTTSLTFIPTGAASSRTVRRESIVELQTRTGPRGSKRGAIIGASAGAAFGFLSALVLAYKDCGGNCADERALIGLSLVGMPVGGGMAGYYAFPGRPRVETIYRRSLVTAP
jgi:hypothetical protein